MSAVGGATWETAGDLPIGYRSPPTPDPDAEGRWWKFTPTEDAVLAFDTGESVETAPGDGNTAIRLYTGPDYDTSTEVAYFGDYERNDGFHYLGRGLYAVTAGVEYHVLVVQFGGVVDYVLSITETYEGDSIQDPDETFEYATDGRQWGMVSPGWPTRVVVNELYSIPVAISRIATVWGSMGAQDVDAIDGNHAVATLGVDCLKTQTSGVDQTSTLTSRTRQTQQTLWDIEDTSGDIYNPPPDSDVPPEVFGLDVDPSGYTWLSASLASITALVQSKAGPVGAGMPDFGTAKVRLRVSPTSTRGSGRVVDEALINDVAASDTWTVPDEPLTSSDYSADGTAYWHVDIEDEGPSSWTPSSSTVTNIRTGLNCGVSYDAGFVRLLRPPTYQYIYATEPLNLFTGVAPPCHLYPRDDDLGVGTAAIWPPPSSQQAAGQPGGYY